MANKGKEVAKDANKVAVVADTASLAADKAQASTASSSANVVYIASSLQNGMTFTDLKTVKSGRVTIPGLNNRLQGTLEAALLADGGASVLFKLPADQWAEIKAMYGSMPAFTHKPPFLREVKSASDYQSNTLQSELKEVRMGAEPLTTSELSAQKAQN